MAGELEDVWHNLTLTEEEKNCMEIENLQGDVCEIEGKSSLVRSLLTKRPLNKEAMLGTLRVVCKISKETKVTVFDANLFLLKFVTIKDKYRVLSGFP